PGALKEAELIEKIRDAHVLGIRSKTRVTPAALAEARRLLTAAGSPFAASAMRDLVAGRRTEGDHIVGDLVRRAQRHGLHVPILESARILFAAHEARLARRS
ncbi:MAG: ketopantoate reductase C-terminal domain-containing protein, partial [Stellaceae bacterium]